MATAALRLRSGQALGCPAGAQTGGPPINIYCALIPTHFFPAYSL